MNTVANIICAVTDADLQKAMHEMKLLRDTGVLSTGVVRDVAKTIACDMGIHEGDALKVAKVELVEAAAFKWASLRMVPATLVFGADKGSLALPRAATT